MIIIEGMDNSGKSTLAATLSASTGTPIEHSPSHLVRDGKFDEWLFWIEWSMLREREHYIFDRHPITSEPVYGPVLRKVDLLSTTHYLVELQRLEPLIIFCRPPTENIFNFQKEEAEGVIEHKVELLHAYDDFMSKLMQARFHVHKYDYTREEADSSILPKVIRHLEGKPSFVVIQGGKVDG